MTSSASITRRITFSVLALEFLAALVLIATVANHERDVQFTVFKTNLRASANALFGTLQEAESKGGGIALDPSGLSLPAAAVYKVSDGNGNILGVQGPAPLIEVAPGTFTKLKIQGRPYLFYGMSGERAIDPGKPFAVYHHVHIVYGLPTKRVWHEVVEAVRFFALATLVLLGTTAFFLTWLIRKLLTPVRELALEAERINTDAWVFNAPQSSKRFLELRPLASAIEKSIYRLQRSFEQQRRFTSDAAHELKTDLAIIKSSLQVLGMRRRTVEEYEYGLVGALEDQKRLESTVQKMLALARVEQAPMSQNQSCDFSEVVLESVALSQPFAEIRSVTIVPSGTGQGVQVPIGKEDALLLCANVLMNALQHSPSHSRVDVMITETPGSVCLKVRDRGPGIEEEDRLLLFDAFYRGDTSRSRETGGTGLGLSICKAICDRSGGSISISNHPDGGAIVDIRLPVLPADYPIA
jgi:signal transduction histidine kinase